MLHHAIHQAIIGIHPLVLTLQPLPTLVSRDAQRDTVFWPQLLELGHHAVGDDGCAFRIQAVHHGGQQLEFGLHGMGEEVGVDKDRVGWDKAGVVGEEEGGGDLRDFAHDFVGGFLLGDELGFGLIFFSGLEVSIEVFGKSGFELNTYNRESRWPIIRLTYW